MSPYILIKKNQKIDIRRQGGGINTSDYRLDFGSVVSPGDTERLYSLLSIVSEDDELAITVGCDDPEQINTIVDVLKDNDFKVSTSGGNDGRECHITAHRIH